MQSIIEPYIQTSSLHHAYVIEGERAFVDETLVPFFETHMGYSTHANPDFMHVVIDSFGIEDSRLLKEMQLRKSFKENGKKIFVITIGSITHEAQHSLLKVLEEPTQGTHFFFIMPSVNVLLPTILSRVVCVSREGNMRGGALYARFLSASPAQRMTILEDILEEKDKAKAVDFLQHLEIELYNMWKKRPDKHVARALKDVVTTRSYLFDRSPSVKMLLEHVALVMPIC